MQKPEAIPEAVKAGIERYARQHAGVGAHATALEVALLDELKWDGIMRCYYFHRSGMFHGVELDGHIHT